MSELSADEVRPLTDYVSVKSATIAGYAVTAELDIPDGPDAQTVLENAISTLTSYTQLSHRINASCRFPLSTLHFSSPASPESG
jgi:phage-related baseplate assembly protein